ncbi:peptidoglycan-binding domain-containing protein [Microcoleus sp. A006_D1]|uniref:peptidoglycan-binding domain-containing protein n=1 Tax=Microcoleus sp. A006_D1 TaxID=3055267 RepID=UPI002FD726BD
MQTRLQGLGFYTGSISGVFDTPTKDALDRARAQLRRQQPRFVEPNFLAPDLRTRHQINRVSGSRLIPETIYFPEETRFRRNCDRSYAEVFC